MRPSLAGIGLVARYELRMRFRAGRWRWLLAAWFTILFLVTLGAREAVRQNDPAAAQAGTMMYGVLMLVTLALALLVAPSLTAQTVNGDRQRGTLATLQATRLTAFDIAAGKLAAAWGAALLFLAVTAPLVGWSMAEGGVPVARVAAVTVVVALLLGVICAIALGLSALLARVTTSGMLSYLAVFALTVGTLIAFGLATATTMQTIPPAAAADPPSHCGSSDGAAPADGGCADVGYTVARTDRTWWLLAPNPFVVLADAAPVAPAPTMQCRDVTVPAPPPAPVPSPGAVLEAPQQSGVQVQRICSAESTFDPLGAISRQVRDLRRPPTEPGSVPAFALDATQQSRGGLVWPWGLGFDVLLGAGMLAVAIRRLQTPARRLGTGVRVA